MKIFLEILSLGHEWQKPQSLSDWVFLFLPWVICLVSLILAPFAGIAVTYIIWG